MTFIIPPQDHVGPRIREEGFGTSWFEINPIVFEAPSPKGDRSLGVSTYRFDPTDWTDAAWPVRLFWMIANTFASRSRDEDLRVVIPSSVGLGSHVVVAKWNVDVRPIIEGSTDDPSARVCEFENAGPIVVGSVEFCGQHRALGSVMVERFEDNDFATYRISVSDLTTLDRVLDWFEIRPTHDQRDHARVRPDVLPLVEVDQTDSSTALSMRRFRLWGSIGGFWRSQAVPGLEDALGRCLLVEDLRELGIHEPMPRSAGVHGYYQIIDIVRGDDRIVYGVYNCIEYCPSVSRARHGFVAASSSAFLTLASMCVAPAE